MALFLWMTDGSLRLILTNKMDLVNEIIQYEQKHNLLKSAKLSTDRALIEFLYEKGYRQTMRTYKFWNVTSKTWTNELDKYSMETLF